MAEEENVPVKKVKTTADLQRIKLERLMKNPEKQVFIPDRPKAKDFKPPPEFVRNAWGSSAGAGSGDFHVYRAVRRREYARQKFLDEKLNKLTADDKYHIKVEGNQILAEERTSKKRAKRLKKKQNKKQKGKQEKSEMQEQESSEEESGSEEEVVEEKEEASKTTDVEHGTSQGTVAKDEDQRDCVEAVDNDDKNSNGTTK